jgi:hypothetical protein
LISTVRSRLRSSLGLLAALLAAAVLASTAQADGPHRTGVGLYCEGTAIEGTTMSQLCETLVEDGSSEPTPPTGVMTMNHAIACTLVPVSADTSACEFALTTPLGDYALTSRYPGDATHASSELSMAWDVGLVGDKIGTAPVFVPAELVASPKTESPPPENATATPPAPVAATALRARIAVRPAKRTLQRLARFRFAGDTSFECKLDQGPYRPCPAVFVHRVATGMHVLRVRPAGGDETTSFRWRVLSRR